MAEPGFRFLLDGLLEGVCRGACGMDEGGFFRAWRRLASGPYFMDYLRDYLSLVEPLAVLAALNLTKDP